MKNQLNIALKAASERGLAEGVCSGISAAVSVVKKKVRYRGFFGGGITRSDHATRKVNETTLFDLASLTKPLCTTLSILALIDAGRLAWSDPCLSLFDPALPAEKAGITIRDILRHASGLPAYHPYFLEFAPHATRNNIPGLLDKILAEPLAYPPGSTSLYSDLGFILLGRLVELKTGHSLDRFFCRNITEPLALDRRLLFLPVGTVGEHEREAMAATEACPWRHKLLQGEVHDEHCWLMGGVAGHAGLFGTAASVLRVCESLLDCWLEKGRHPAFSNDLLRFAFEWRSNSGQWSLGFDRPTPGQSSSGRYFSPRSVGHLGFTGTSFWMDPERELIVVLLTNRVHPSRENVKIRQFRPFFHDYLLEKSGIA